VLRRPWCSGSLSLCAVSFRLSRGQAVGDSGGGGPPGPFSNPAVKPTRADGTRGASPRETRSSPTPAPCLTWGPFVPDNLTLTICQFYATITRRNWNGAWRSLA
jgi:hypothetical protein